MTFADAAEQHLDDVFAYLVYLTGDRAAAEDLAGETFEKGLRLWGRFDERRGSVRTWLCQIARTTALDWFRAERRRRARENVYALHTVERAGDELFGQGLAPELERALANLSPAEREVIALASCSNSTGPPPRACSGSARPRAPAPQPCPGQAGGGDP